jgi:hypothetical protein
MIEKTGKPTADNELARQQAPAESASAPVFRVRCVLFFGEPQVDV